MINKQFSKGIFHHCLLAACWTRHHCYCCHCAAHWRRCVHWWGKSVWSFDDLMVWCFDDLMIWSFDDLFDLMIWGFDGLMISWFDGLSCHDILCMLIKLIIWECDLFNGARLIIWECEDPLKWRRYMSICLWFVWIGDMIRSSFMMIWCYVSLYPCFNTNIIIETKYLVKLFLLKTILMRLLELFSLKSEENEDLVRGCLLVEDPPFGQDASELRGGGAPWIYIFIDSVIN